ncbi:dipeptidyl peptidase 9 [Leptidea sinapis]|uniref:dipeptidyl peptidase 9 n=1 Tax=Leptidea sinapis TaxID=189913 RepID=UPI0021C34999|nr:dipeptidyl peptidase 9 [Leptidea sinapis]
MEFLKMEVREAGDGAASDEYDRDPPKKYSWAEVRQAVHDLRKELSSLSTMVPMSISFRKLANGKTRIYFLRTPQNGWEVTLLYTDVLPTLQLSNIRIDWKPLIESNVALDVSSGKWSREEQLLWERQRVAAWGIASYELHPQSGRLLFPCASSLFVAEEGPSQSPPLVPRSLNTGGGAPLTPAMCPSANLVAHAARGDIWLAGDCLRRPTRLTYACKGREERLSDDPMQAGVPCYVMQEEFSRYTGFWWQPSTDDDVYRIVYEEVDESLVNIFSFPSSSSSSGEVEEFRFPRAGTPNAKSALKLVTFRLQKATSTVLDYYNEGHSEALPPSSSEGMEVTDIRWYEMRRPLSEVFPWFEYLARVGWTPCGKYVWVQLLDRKQQKLELALIPLSEFCVRTGYALAGPPNVLADEVEACNEQPIQVLVTETAPDAWINVHDILHFLPSPQGLSFIWASEETGHLHLYLISADLGTQKPTGVADILQADETYASRPKIISKEAITSGEWEVMGRKIWVDETRGLVYFLGLRETPLERHLYAASLTPPAPNELVLLTQPGHSHTVDLHLDSSVAVITSSNISSVGVTRVYRISHNGRVSLIRHGTLALDSPDSRLFNGAWERTGNGEDTNDVSRLIRERSLSSVDVPPPQIYSMTLSCGQTAYCTLWRSSLGGPRPTVLHVYGGPEVQTVTNSYKGIRQLRMHMLTARGFTVVSVDSRGSKHRGRAWEAAIRGKMGQVELDDQVEVLQWLAKETGCVDMERVAIHGWSYGGYLSLLGLATRPHIFQVCVAGAPVTSWRLYDTAYTERYMGLPADTHHAYNRASVIAHAPFFPDREGRLLIIHGLADENVHFCHTAALLSELVRLGKPHRVQVYPGERHSLRAMHAAKHYEATLLHFLHENL